jgi:hypothetical protein
MLQNYETILNYRLDQIEQHRKQIEIHSAEARKAFLKLAMLVANRTMKEKGLIPGKLHSVPSMPEKNLRFVKMEVSQFSSDCFDLDKALIYAVFDELTDNGRKRPNGEVRLNVRVYGV